MKFVDLKVGDRFKYHGELFTKSEVMRARQHTPEDSLGDAVKMELFQFGEEVEFVPVRSSVSLHSVLRLFMISIAVLVALMLWGMLCAKLIPPDMSVPDPAVWSSPQYQPESP